MKKAIRGVAKKAVEAVRKKGFKTCVGSSGTIQSLSLVHEAAILGREPSPTGHRTLTRDGLKKVNRLMRRTTEKEKLRVSGPRSAPARHRGPGRRAAVLDPQAHGRRGDRRGRAGPARGPAARLARAARRVPVPGLPGHAGPRAWTGCCGAATPRSSTRPTSRAWRSSSSTRPIALHQLTATEREWLQYGALLHDIGCYIGYAKHQRHSYYLITHGDLTGSPPTRSRSSRRSRATTRADGPRRRTRTGGGSIPTCGSWSRSWRRSSGSRTAWTAATARSSPGSRAGCGPRKIELEATARADCEPELDAARKKANLFERVFDRSVVLRAVPAGLAEEVLQKDLEILSAEALWN